jgi:RNA polymerase sigma-70 factor (ECF subfamily)
MGRDFHKQALSHVDVLHNLARYLVGKQVDAEDLVQEAYVRAFAGEERFTGGNLKAWLCRILRNVWIDRWRVQRDETPFDEHALPASLTSEQLDAVGLSELEGAMMALPEESRTVLLLQLEGFSEHEMATILVVAAGTVKSRLSRAKARLRVLLVRGAP